jgi:hypothetical protein
VLCGPLRNLATAAPRCFGEVVGFRLLQRVAFASFLLVALPVEVRAEPVDAATRSAARDLGYAGVAAYQSGDYATASAKLEKAYAVLKAPSLGLWSARALARLGKLVEASERYVDVTRLDASTGDQAVHEQAKKDARSEHEALVPKIPKLVVLVRGVDPAEVSVTIDGQPMANALIGEQRPVNPGQHSVQGKRGDEVVESRAAVPQGGEQSVELVFKGGPLPVAATAAAAGAAGAEPPGQPASAAQADTGRNASGSGTLRTFGWISLVAGGVGLVGGSITGIVALDWKSQIENSDKLYNDANEDRYNTLRAISIGSLVGGGALALTGLIILVAAPAPNSASGTPGTFVGVNFAPNAVHVHGTF